MQLFQFHRHLNFRQMILTVTACFAFVAVGVAALALVSGRYTREGSVQTKTLTSKYLPGIVSLAKGISSAYLPLSASVISERVWNGLRDASPEIGPVMHGFTYSGHPVGGAVAMANLDIMDQEGLIENSAAMGVYFKKRLA